MSLEQPKLTFKLKKKDVISELNESPPISLPSDDEPTTTTKKKTDKIIIKSPLKSSTKKPKSLVSVRRLLFIDASFFIFYRYNATKVWYSTHKAKEGECNIENEEFVQNYTKHFNDWVTKIKKKTNSQHVYWFKDSPLDTLWRIPIFPSYKSNREDKCPKEISAFFRYTYEKLIPPNNVISIKQAEADDCVDIAVRFENKTNPDTKIVIVTGDTDYIQLINDNTRVIKMPKLDDMPVEIKLGKDKKDKIKTTPSIFINTKILLGDACDEIPKVYSGCGPKTAYDIARDPDMFKKLIEDHPDRYANYKKNRILMHFDEIPNDIRKEGEELYQYLVSINESKS